MLLSLVLSFIFGATVGVLSAFLGIGGGVIIVPSLVAIGFEAKQAVAISALSIVLTSASATFKNWRQGALQITDILWICAGALITAPLGSLVATFLSEATVLLLFAGFLFTILATMNTRAKLKQKSSEQKNQAISSLKFLFGSVTAAKIFTGSLTGFCSGLFGVGGGVILVPLQVLLLKLNLKQAIKNSLGVILPTATVTALSHAALGNLIWEHGLLIGSGGIVGAQLGTALLQRGSENLTRRCFQAILLISTLTTLYKAINLIFSIKVV